MPPTTDNAPSSPPASTLVPLLDAPQIAECICKMAASIASKHPTPGEIIVAGIPTRGVEVARRIIREIHSLTGESPELGTVDVSMHRDDLATRSRITALQATDLPFAIENRTLVLVDDVLFTGRSVRAALDAISSYGRPGRIELAVLVDRGHRELPIQPDYTGITTSTEFSERIRVRFENLDCTPDAVHLVKP